MTLIGVISDVAVICGVEIAVTERKELMRPRNESEARRLQLGIRPAFPELNARLNRLHSDLFAMIRNGCGHHDASVEDIARTPEWCEISIGRRRVGVAECLIAQDNRDIRP